MPTSSPTNVRGRDLPLVRPGWFRDEVGLCDALAAIWERLSPKGQLRMAEVFLAAAGLTDALPEDSSLRVWREVPWDTEGDDHDQRMDFVVRIRGWGTLVIEAKVSQSYWRSSGPRKLPGYAVELRRRVSLGPEPGPRAVLVALTPQSVPSGDVPAVEGVKLGALTWAAVAAAYQAWPTDGPGAVDQMLLAELTRHLEERGFTKTLEGCPMSELAALPDALDLVLRVLPRIDDFLGKLAGDAEELGLVDPERLDVTEDVLDEPQIFRPAIWWDVEGGHRDMSYVALMLDLRERRSVLVAGVQADDGAEMPAGLATDLVKSSRLDGAHLARCRPAGLELMPCTAEAAAKLDAIPVDLEGEYDWEWRGLALVKPWGDGELLGAVMLQDLLGFIEAQGPQLARPVLRSDMDDASPRPPLEVVRGTLALWPEGSDLREGLTGLKRAFGWTEENLVDEWLRLLTDDKGKAQYVNPRRERWKTPLTSKGLYVSGEVVRCCGVPMEPETMRRKVTCPVCGRKWWNRDVVALGA